MNSYPLRWMHLQKGVSVENEVRGLIMRVSYRLSKERGVRANLYYPALDIDGTDMRLVIQGASGEWTASIDIAVRSSSRPAIILGREESYGTLRRWLKRSTQHKSPSLFFQFDWSTTRLFLMTPADLRRLSEGKGTQSIPLPPTAEDVEARLFNLLSTVASAATESDARQLLL